MVTSPDLRSAGVRALFLYSLPVEIVEQIVHYLSHRPRSVNWQCFVEACDVQAVLDASESLRLAALRKFRSLSLFEQFESRDAHRWEVNTNQKGLLVDNSDLLTPLLAGLGDGLNQLTVFNVSGIGHSWVEVLTRSAFPIMALTLHNLEDSFPLDDVLAACGKLTSLSLKFNEYATLQHLECVADRASRVAQLELHNVNGRGGFHRIWRRLQLVEDLTITTTNFPTIEDFREHGGKTMDIYRGIARADSRLRSLSVGTLNFSNLIAVMLLCHKLGDRPLELSFELERMCLHNAYHILNGIKNACPQVAVSVKCHGYFLQLLMSVLRDSLVEVDVFENVFKLIPGGLADAAARCTKLRRIALFLDDRVAESFLDQLLTHCAGALRDLKLYVYPSQRPEALAFEQPPYLRAVAQHTGNLRRLVMNARPDLCLTTIAAANASLREVEVHMDSFMFAVDCEAGEKWVVGVVDDFLANCLQIEDIVMTETRPAGTVGSLFPKGTRIAALDAKRFSELPQRKVGVRVNSAFYDIE